MKKRIALLLAVMLTLLSGCAAGDLSRYPVISQEQALPRTRLVLLVGEEEWLFALGSQLSEVVSDLSGGAVSLLVTPVGDPSEAFAAEEGDLCFISSEELTRADPGLSYLRLPFLFAAPEDALTCLNGEESPVTASALLQQRYGTLIGAYYDSGWCMAVNEGAITIGSLYLGRFGVNQRFTDRECFLPLGAADTAAGDTKRLMQLLSEDELAAIEISPEELTALQQGLSVYPSRHRIEVQYLFLRQQAADERVLPYLRQAFHETVTQASIQRMQWEEEQLNSIGGQTLPSDAVEPIFRQAGFSYRWRGTGWGLPEGFADRWCAQ